MTSGGKVCVMTEKIKRKISLTETGKIVSDETRRKQSELKKGKYIGKDNPFFKSYIRCIETGEVYEGFHDAQRKTGIQSSSICFAVKGRYKTAGGYHWEYVSE